MSARWRVAIIGLGHWYSAYGLARSLREYPRAELVAVAWPDRRQRDEFASTFNVRSYDDYDDLLKREDVDVVHLSAPVSELEALTLSCARAGKHIILGKPMAMDGAQADRMVRAVHDAGIVCVPMQGMMRLRGSGLKARIDSGTIGNVVLLHQVCRWSIAEDWYQSGKAGWFADPRHVPGGAFIDEGIYWIDFFRWVTGSEVVSVEAKTANLVHTEMAVEDWGMAAFTFENGVLATLEASWTINAPRKTGPSPKQNSVVRLEIIGTRGEIIEQWFRDPVRAVLAAGASEWVFERQSEQPFVPQAPVLLAHLIDCVENGRKPAATIEDARRSLVIALAAYESAREGRRVQLSS